MARALTILRISFFSNLKKMGIYQHLMLGAKGKARGRGGIDVGDSPRNEEFHQKMVSFRVIEALRYALVGLVSTLSRRRAVVSREVILRRR